MFLSHNANIRKANRRKSIDHTAYWYLDKVYVDIGFGDTMVVGGTCYVLVFVDCATYYNWVFSLKSLPSTDIREAFNLFCSQAGRFFQILPHQPIGFHPMLRIMWGRSTTDSLSCLLCLTTLDKILTVDCSSSSDFSPNISYLMYSLHN